ncbi:hypothetical protein SAMN05216326_10147 [Nitrosomonas marina]|uniref:Uncharacterized protein n=1 Tax=Nitrosomonas marina TaxID=917 RepID=A0A1H9Y4H4_9PROT|nr:hypothetical protein [Nitrosomonas marina]SES63260.1 hypothetical protein SAMN05216326_10147 [Nitrosomonas marina]
MNTIKSNQDAVVRKQLDHSKKSIFQWHIVFFLLLLFSGFSGFQNTAYAQAKTLELDTCSQCKVTISQRIAQLQEIKKQLDKNYITDKNLALLIKWKERFKIDIKQCDLADEIKGLVTGESVSILATLLSSMELTAEVVSASTGIGALISLVGIESYTAIYNIGYWKIIDQNTAIYQWLVDFLEYGRTGRLDKNTVDFLYDNQKAVEAITGKKLPARSNKKAIESYLKSHAVSLFYTIGQIEEKFGSAKFPRIKINDFTGNFKGSRYDVGYYRYVLTSVLTSEIGLAINELLKLKGKTCNSKAHTLINGKTFKGKPLIDTATPKETTTKPINKLKVNTPNGGLKKLDDSHTGKTITVVPR